MENLEFFPVKCSPLDEGGGVIILPLFIVNFIINEKYPRYLYEFFFNFLITQQNIA